MRLGERVKSKPAVAVGCMLLAAIVADAFDQLFIRVRIPGIGWCLWILATILTFGAGGYVTGRYAAVSKWTSGACIVTSACLYAAAGAYTLMNTGAHLRFELSLPAVAQSFVLALIGGFSGLRRGTLDGRR